MPRGHPLSAGTLLSCQSSPSPGPRVGTVGLWDVESCAVPGSPAAAPFSSRGVRPPHKPLSVLSGESTPRQSRSPAGRKGKHRRKKPPPPGSCSARDACCPHATAQAPDAPPWGPAAAPAPGLPFPAAVLVPGPAPCLVPAVPALPAAYPEAFVTVFLPDTPVWPLLAPSCTPFLGAADPSLTPCSVSPVAVNPEPPSSVIHHSRPGGPEETWSEGCPSTPSGSSSPLQLSFLGEDAPGAREPAGPRTQCVSQRETGLPARGRVGPPCPWLHFRSRKGTICRVLVP